MPFRQRLNGAMHYVARIFRVTDIDDNWRHRQVALGHTATDAYHVTTIRVAEPDP